MIYGVWSLRLVLPRLCCCLAKEEHVACVSGSFTFLHSFLDRDLDKCPRLLKHVNRWSSLSHLKKCGCYFNFKEVGKEPQATCVTGLFWHCTTVPSSAAVSKQPKVALVDLVEDCTYTHDSKDSSFLSHYAYTLGNPGVILTYFNCGDPWDKGVTWCNWVTGLLPLWKTITWIHLISFKHV
jgi:hypothetical protein